MKNVSSLLLTCLLLAAGSNPVHAGSVTFAELEGVIKSNPKLLNILEAIAFEENGTGTRLGKNFRGAHGSRVGPYEFRGRGRSDTGPFDLKVTLVTEWHLEDRDGNVFRGDPPQPPADDRPLEIREKLIAIEISDSITPAAEGSTKPTGNDAVNTQEGANPNPPPPSPPQGTSGLNGTFAEGDYRYATEYYCDNFSIRLRAGQVLDVALYAQGVTPEIMSKKEQWSGSAGPRSAATAPGEPAVIRYQPQNDGTLILMATNKDKLTTGTYRLDISIDGKPLVFPSPLPAAQTNRKIVPLN